jgi:hypothetical protein
MSGRRAFLKSLAGGAPGVDPSLKVGFADAIRARETACDSNKWHYASDQVSTEQDGFLGSRVPLCLQHL